MLKRINILEELQKQQQEIKSKRLIADVNDLLKSESESESKILNSIRFGNKSSFTIDSNNLNPEKIFTVDAIKSICIQYRLRFLDADLFKGEIPYEAISEIKKLSKETNAELKYFKIMAPSRLFRLTDADADPLLFVPTADGKYYLIHKWGTDLSWYNKITQFPSRSLGSLVTTILIFAFFIALIIPNEWLIPKSFMANNNVFGYWGFHRVAFFFHATILICGMTIFWWFAFHKNFSDAEWNKKTFN